VQPWKTRERRIVLQPDDGRFLTVESHVVELPDGRVIREWPWVITPDYVNIVAVTENERVLCFRQTKYAVAGSTLALPGGYLEPGEEPLAAARRELLEETGHAAAEWRALGQYAVDGNRGAGTAHFFLARNARPQQPVHADDLEEQQLLLLDRAAVEAALRNGEFKVLPWSAALALALLQLDG
jgi:ADP-ribose pyrophosphatase